jgi:hypothetical protein
MPVVSNAGFHERLVALRLCGNVWTLALTKAGLFGDASRLTLYNEQLTQN